MQRRTYDADQTDFALTVHCASHLDPHADIPKAEALNRAIDYSNPSTVLSTESVARDRLIVIEASQAPFYVNNLSMGV